MKKIVVSILILITLGLITFYFKVKVNEDQPQPVFPESKVNIFEEQVERREIEKEGSETEVAAELELALEKIEVESYSQLVELVNNFISEHQSSQNPRTKELLVTLGEELQDYGKLLEGLDKTNPKKSTPIIEKLEVKRDEILDLIDDISVIEH